jgi:alkyl sulfatase BDS1-like metallo-beta-lactamase superfamily hydrolase
MFVNPYRTEFHCVQHQWFNTYRHKIESLLQISRDCHVTVLHSKKLHMIIKGRLTFHIK